VRQIEEDGTDVSKIRAIQDKHEIAAESSELESVVMDSVRRTSIAWKIADIYSGEAFVEDYRTEGAGVLKALDEEKVEEAEEKFKQIIICYDKAAQATRLSSGAEYFRIEKERRISAWEPMKRARLRLARISKAKVLIMEIVRMKPGIRQADLHKNINEFDRDIIWEAAYRLYEEGLIRRVTCGKSYQLYNDTVPPP
jgi:type I restriction-modification system DNA methylase subunit